MIIIAVVDDNNGIAFNNRRQSQDRLLREHILSMTENKPLWMNHYSEKQFVDIEGKNQIIVDDLFLQKVASGEYCFIENTAVSLYKNRIEKIILFKWNRKYPADMYFDVDLTSPEWKLQYTDEIKGFSHEKITEEIYSHE